MNTVLSDCLVPQRKGDQSRYSTVWLFGTLLTVEKPKNAYRTIPTSTTTSVNMPEFRRGKSETRSKTNDYLLKLMAAGLGMCVKTEAESSV